MRYGPKIITDRLAFYVDAGVSGSYPGSGTIWYDIGPNNIILNKQGTTQTPHSIVGGAWAFDFNNSGYWQSSTADGQLVDMRYDCTLEMWLYAETITERDTVFEKVPLLYNSYEEELACTWEVAGHINTFRGRTTYDTYNNTGPVLQLNKWNYWVVTLPTWPANMQQYLNCVQVGSTLQRSTTQTQAGAIRIGSGYVGVMEAGAIAICRIYNKVLTNDELYYNFNAQRGRFGI